MGTLIELAIDIAAAPGAVFAALADLAAGARWGPPGFEAAAVRAAVPGHAVEIVWLMESGETSARLTLEARGDTTRVALAHEGFEPDPAGEIAAARAAAGWRFALEALRADLERGVALADLAPSRLLHEEGFECEERILAPPAQVARALAEEAPARGEVLLSSANPSRVTCARPLADCGEIAVIDYAIARAGPGTALAARAHGFATFEHFWDVEQRVRLCPSLVIALREEEGRLYENLSGLRARLEDGGVLEVDVEILAPAAEVAAAIAALDTARGWRVIEGGLDDRAVLMRPDGALAELALLPARSGGATRAIATETGFAGAPERRAEAERDWTARLAELERSFLEQEKPLT